MKKSKQSFHDKYLVTNWNNIKDTRKGIKSLIFLQTEVSIVSTALSLNNSDTITNPFDIGNTSNNYFTFIAEITKKSIKYSHEHFYIILSMRMVHNNISVTY